MRWSLQSTLHHENVVRVFKTVDIPASGSGTTELKFPADLKTENASVIAFVQKTGTMELGAAVAEQLPKP
jgi:hypothetical protein